MAIGDEALAAGMSWVLVPITGEQGKVKYGAQEINRTRDYIAQVKALITTPWPISKGGTGATTAAAARTALGLAGAITYGTGNPTGGSTGDIYIKYY